MEKCSLKKHEEIDAISFCQECNKYMCQKCHYHHNELFENHSLNILTKFIGLCPEESHSDNLEYFCKNHNILCCAACISKIQSKGNGLHKDCNVCNAEEIKEEKLQKLKENIKSLENLSSQFDAMMEEIKLNFKNVTKETTEKKIQNTFKNIKESINEREKEIMSKFDDLINNHYDEMFLKEKQKYDSTLKKIEKSITKSKEIENELNDSNKYKASINECLIIEDNMKNLNKDLERIKNEIDVNRINSGIKFYPGDDESINEFTEKLKKFGHIYQNSNIFKFKKCPDKISENKLYTISGKDENIITKTGNDGWVGISCQNSLEKNKTYIWTVKILKSYNNTIMVGVAPIDFDINSSSYSNNGWYFYCHSSTLYSGAPENYNNRKTNLPKVKEEIKIVMNTESKSLKFIVDGEDKGESYLGLFISKPFVPVVFLYNKNDSVEINEN
jgi:hypothetical protein